MDAEITNFKSYGEAFITSTIQDEMVSRLLSAGDIEKTLSVILETGISPYSAQALQMRAMMALRQKDYPRAEQLIVQSLKMKKDPLTVKLAGDTHFLQSRFKQAENCYREALSMAPAAPEIMHDLGVALVSQAKIDECILWMKKCSQLSPERADFRHHIALMQLLKGEEEEGWDAMQWRMHYPGVTGGFPHPERYWQGEPLEGKTIFVRTEQGWGDAFMFAGYLPALIARAKKVYIFSQRALIDWFRHYYPQATVWPNDAPPPLDFDYHVNIMCLPRLAKEYTLPRKKTVRGSGVGICWYGSPTHKNDHLRSVPVERFEPVAKTLGENLKCLGYGRFDMTPPFMEYYIDDCPDWVDTAKKLQKLDLVITVDTAIAHLAGYVGTETWLLLPHVPDFRWGLQGSETKWYESMKLYRCPDTAQWDPVFQQVCQDLEQRKSKKKKAA